MAQAEDRCHRVGQLNSVRVQYYVFRDTIDEWIAQTLIKKQNNIEQILPSEETSTSTISNGKELPSSASGYTFDFGKYKGLRLEDTPGDFIQYLIKKEIWRKHPKLWHALHWKGLLLKKPSPTTYQPTTLKLSFDLNAKSAVHTNEVQSTTNGVEPSPTTPCANDQKMNNVSFKFDFGMHVGRDWQDVPLDYQNWILKERVWKNRKNLESALIKAGIINYVGVDKTDPSDKLQNDDDSSSCQSQKKVLHLFPIKSFRLTAQCPYIIKELEARNIAIHDADRKKITRLKKQLLDWHTTKYPGATLRKIELLDCDAEKLWSVTKNNK